jgi:Uma2 family endonuclease
MPAGDQEVPMTSTIFGRGMPMTEQEFLALGETSERIELFDGSLFVTPAPTPGHQFISRRLANALDAGADTAGLHVSEAVNVRLRPDRIPIPDIVVTTSINFNESVVDAGAVRLVCEIVSPSNASTDKVLKMYYYAAAKIPWYLLVEQETGTLRLHELSGDEYIERATAKPGEILRLTEPLTADLDPANLLPPS